MAYKVKKYRSRITSDDLVSFRVRIRETDLLIRADQDLTEVATNTVLRYRKFLEEYIQADPFFQATLEPYLDLPVTAPKIVQQMARAAAQVGIGPMAAVAGAISEFVGTKLLEHSSQIIVENGGDIFLKTKAPRLIGLYAGSSPFTHKVALSVQPGDTPLGICTSSGTVGHSLSYGQADAVVVTAQSALLADAAATAIGNLVNEPEDFSKGIEFAKGISSLRGLVIIKNDQMAVWGEIQLEKIN